MWGNPWEFKSPRAHQTSQYQGRKGWKMYWHAVSGLCYSR